MVEEAAAEDIAEVTASAVVETMLVVEMLLRDLMQSFPLTVVVKTEGVAMQCTESKDGLTRPKTEKKRSRVGRGIGHIRIGLVDKHVFPGPLAFRNNVSSSSNVDQMVRCRRYWAGIVEHMASIEEV